MTMTTIISVDVRLASMENIAEQTSMNVTAILDKIMEPARTISTTIRVNVRLGSKEHSATHIQASRFGHQSQTGLFFSLSQSFIVLVVSIVLLIVPYAS